MSTSYCLPIRRADWLEPDPVKEWSKTKKEARLLLIIDERVAKALSAAADIIDTPVEQRFHQLAEQWEQETGSLSSQTKKIMNRHYQAIVGMGPQIIPALLRDIQDNRRDWFWALSAITQENPINRADAGNVDKMAAAWVTWGRKKGIL